MAIELRYCNCIYAILQYCNEAQIIQIILSLRQERVSGSHLAPLRYNQIGRFGDRSMHRIFFKGIARSDRLAERKRH
jgi:hypothetical protein